MTTNPVAATLAELPKLPREELITRWQTCFGCPPPRQAHRGLLVSVLAWHLQMRAQSEWTPAKIRRLLVQATGGSVLLQPGTRLVREWQGRHYQVTVLPSGFEYEGCRYNSLTAIAREITGISWSGPRFFGLKS